MAKTSGVSVPLRAARERLEKTQRDIATELDVTQAAVSYWEAGATPRPELWGRIAKAYDVSEAELTKQFLDAMKAS